MSQQINLFNPLFRKKGFSFTSATAMVYGVGVVVAAGALIAGYQNYRLREVEALAQASEREFRDATARVDKLTTAIAQQKPNAQLAAEIVALDAQLKGRQEIIETLKNGAVGNTDGFSEYMRAFSRQSVNGLWLTGFDIALAGKALAIQGRTLNADLVAGYLKQLNQEKAMQGREFAAMRISQPPPIPAGAGTEDPKAAKDAQVPADAKERKPSPPRYLVFTISTFDLPDVPQSVVKPAPADAPLLGPMNPSAAFDAAKAGARPEGAR